VERATGSIEDRKIFATMVARIVPAQIHATVDQVTVQLPWLAGRSVVSTQQRTQTLVTDSQPIELEHENVLDLRVDDLMSVLDPAIEPEKSSPDPHPPIEAAGTPRSE
jgi:tetrahydromethanopterin S-methyltransferase subunit B